MSVIFLLLIVSITVAGLFLAAFIWNVKNGQYDDEAAAPLRMLFDDTAAPEKETKAANINPPSKSL
ncbi:MAG: cbb3-type cytochrome oxidase assembly protein CcoS [Chitinophagaceae bacterium]|nr:cbb3-type cytochrome oxidase assembly protein CcoS [Chitinophagaceae bacterium]